MKFYPKAGEPSGFWIGHRDASEVTTICDLQDSVENWKYEIFHCIFESHVRTIPPPAPIHYNEPQYLNDHSTAHPETNLTYHLNAILKTCSILHWCFRL